LPGEGSSMSTLRFQPEADRYYAEGHWRPGDLWEDFAARAHAHPGKVALVLDDRHVTYDELRRAAVALSARLAAGSVQPGEPEIARCAEAASADAPLIAILPETLDELIAEHAPECRERRRADGIAMVMHSSGTTSEPKGIVHSSNTLRYATTGACRRWALTGDDVYLVATEFGFVGGMVFGYLPVHVARVHRGVRRVSAHAVAEGGQA
jgi:non-ribosomal peptide synthetase component E (peptide arylation enzyme)